MMITRSLMVLALAGVLGCSSESGGSGGGGPGGAHAGGAGGTEQTGGGGGAGLDGSGGSAAPSSGTSQGSGGGSNPCADTKTCGDMSTGCIGCAFAGQCAAEAQVCYHDPDCGEFQTCVGMCAKGDEGCVQGCQEQHPNGAADYGHLYECAICQECKMACADSAEMCH